MEERIPGTSFTKAEEQELIRLFGKVKKDGYRWPTEAAMRAAHRVVSFWAPELVITRQRHNGVETLLSRYDGGVEEFRGKWHIPGGYNRWDESLCGTYTRLARRELDVEVAPAGVLDVYKWGNDHPYGRPLSVYVKCLPLGDITECENLRFFRARRLPTDMVEPHRRFTENHFC